MLMRPVETAAPPPVTAPLFLSPGHGRILLVANNFPPIRGGSAVVYDTLARHAGGRVMVLAATRGYADGLPQIGWREHDRAAPYRVLRLKLLRTMLGQRRETGLARAWFALTDGAIRARVLAVVLWLIAARGVRSVCIGELVALGWLFTPLRALPFVRRVVYMHGEEITTVDGYDDDFRRRRGYVRAAQRIVAVSRFTREVTAALGGPAVAARITLIENGVDPRRFHPGAKRDDLLAFHGLAGAFVFVSVCRLLEKKGVDRALEAFAMLAPDWPEARFLVVGDGPYRTQLEALAMALGVAGRVVFTGLVAEEELVDHYRLGDVFVMPNRELANGDTEGFGLVFLEANACGLPVVAGCAGGSPDAVTDGENGLVADGREVASVERAMRRMIAEPELRARLAAGGLARAAAADWRWKAAEFLGVGLG